jgi:hypothetical protein
VLIVDIVVPITKSPVVCTLLIEVHESSHWQLALESDGKNTDRCCLLTRKVLSLLVGLILFLSSFYSAWARIVVRVKTKRRYEYIAELYRYSVQRIHACHVYIPLYCPIATSTYGKWHHTIFDTAVRVSRVRVLFAPPAT